MLYYLFLVITVQALGGSDASRIYRSAHFLGRGDTGIADADNQEAIHYNPAGIASGKGIYKRIILLSPQLEASTTMRDVYTDLVVEEKDQTETLRKLVGKNQSLGLSNLTAVVLRRAALGVTSSNRVSLLVNKDKDANALETVNMSLYTNQVLSFSLADQFYGEKLQIGSTLKYISRGEADISANIVDAQELTNVQDSGAMGTGTGSAIDLGIRYKYLDVMRSKQYLGLTVSDLGDTAFKPSKEEYTLTPIKQSINIGWMLSISTGISYFKFLADYYDILNASEISPYQRLHAGCEINVLSMIGVTAGLNQGYSTFGLYTDFYFFRLDGGMYTEETGDTLGSYPDKRFFLRILVGL